MAIAVAMRATDAFGCAHAAMRLFVSRLPNPWLVRAGGLGACLHAAQSWHCPSLRRYRHCISPRPPLSLPMGATCRLPEGMALLQGAAHVLGAPDDSRTHC